VLIEPGPIRSAFEDTADEELRRYEAGPYRDVVRGFSKVMAETYRSRLAGTPEQVAKAVLGAATAESPRARIRVTPHAHVLTRARKVLPDRVWDAALASRLP
jgi:hypothetical protein